MIYSLAVAGSPPAQDDSRPKMLQSSSCSALSTTLTWPALAMQGEQQAAPPAHLQMQPRQLPSVQRAAAATGCLDKLPQRAGSAAQRSRWRGRAPPRQGRRAALPGRASRAPPRQGYEKLHKVWGPVAPGVESRRGDRSHHTRPGRGGRGKRQQKCQPAPALAIEFGSAVFLQLP